MEKVDVTGLSLVYLGAIDDKVVEYNDIADANETLNQILFFSTILGDPLVLNDGYLLHQSWGWDQLLTDDSPFNQLNREGHLLLASRSEKPVSTWVEEQARTTISYRKLFDYLKERDPEKLPKVDAAQKRSKGIPWPSIDLQEGLEKLLNTLTPDLSRDLADVKFQSVMCGYENQRLLGETVRSAWEKGLLELRANSAISPVHIQRLMELANEAYHVNFAAGLAKMNGGESVGLSGYGHHRFEAFNAYRDDGTKELERLMTNEVIRRRLEAAATIRIPPEVDLFSRGKLGEFIRYARPQKERYQESFNTFLRSSRSDNERLDEFEGELKRYAALVGLAFGSKSGSSLLRIIHFARAPIEGLRVLAEVYKASEDLEYTAHLGATETGKFYTGRWGDVITDQAVKQVRNLAGTRSGQDDGRSVAMIERVAGVSLFELQLAPSFITEHSRGLREFHRDPIVQ